MMLIVIKLTFSHPNSVVYMHINVYGVKICLKMLFCLVKFKLCFEIIEEKGVNVPELLHYA